jgi:hypothetical protein
MDTHRRWKGWHPVLAVAASIGSVGSVALLTLSIVGWVRVWLWAPVLGGGLLALAIQQYLDIHAGLPTPGDRRARLLFVWALVMLALLAIVAAPELLTGD